MEQTPVRIFISYSRQDELYFKLLKEGIDKHSKHSRKFIWQTWSDQNILPGHKWHEVIQNQVQECDCALLFVSANFINSDYIERHEFDEFVKRQEEGNFRFFPILISPFAIDQWEALNNRQFFHAEGKRYGHPEKKGILSYSELVKLDDKGIPLINPERDRYHMDLIKALEQAIDQFLAERTPKSTSQSLPSPQKDISSEIIPPLKLGLLHFQPENKIEFYEKVEDKVLPVAMQHFRHKRDILSTRSTEEEVAKTFQMGNEIAHLVLEDQKQLREKVLDSEHLKRLYIDVQFDAIAFDKELKYNTEILITQKRQQRARFPWHERSLIVSALTLGLLQNFNPDKIYHLIDFVRDKEDFVWKRALVGLFLGIINHERLLSAELRKDLLVLKKDQDIQEGLLKIEEAFGLETDFKEWEKYKTETRFEDSYEFFEKPQHWFIPFYPGNPVLQQHILDQSLLENLPKSTNWPIDAFKYAFCLNHARIGYQRDTQLLRRIDRASEAANLWYQWNKNKYPKDDSDTAYRKDREFQQYLQEVLFFTANYPADTFKEIKLEKKSLFKTSLSHLLLEDLYLLRIEAIYYCYFANEFYKAVELLLQLLSHFPKEINLLRRIAYCYGKLEDYSKAIEYQLKVSALEPLNANRWEWVAFYQIQKNSFKDALQSLENAHKIDPGSTWTLESFAKCYAQLKNLKQAIEYQQKATEVNPNDAHKWGMLGHYYEESEDFKTALTFRQKAEKLDPNLAWNLAGIAACHEGLGNFEKAIRYQRKATDLEPKNASRWGMLGHCYEENRDFKAALKCRQKAEKLDPDLAWNLAGIAACYEGLKNFEKAIRYQQKAADLKPDDASQWGMLGFYYQQNQDFETALKFRQKAEQLNPNMAWNLAGIADCYDELEDFEKAIQYQQKAADLEPDDASQWGILGYYYEQKKDYKTALKFRQKAKELNPNMAWNLAGIADCYDELEDFEKAIQYQQKAANLEPDDGSRWGILGYYYKQNQDFHTALKFRLKAEKLESNLAWNLAGIADCYNKLEDLEKAIRFQQKATELEPKNSSRWEKLGLYYLQVSKQDQASKHFQKAVSLDFSLLEERPKAPKILASIAWTYFLMGDFEQAKVYFEQELVYLSKQKQTYHPFMNLGHIALIQGDLLEAKRLYEQAIDIAKQKGKIRSLFNGFNEDEFHLSRFGVLKVTFTNLIEEIKSGQP